MRFRDSEMVSGKLVNSQDTLIVHLQAKLKASEAECERIRSLSITALNRCYKLSHDGFHIYKTINDAKDQLKEQAK